MTELFTINQSIDVTCIYKKLSKKYKIILFTFKGHPKRPLVNGKNGIELCWDIIIKKHNVDSYISDIVWGKPNQKNLY